MFFFSDDSSSLSLQNYIISSMIYMKVRLEKYQFSERGRNFLITLYFLHSFQTQYMYITNPIIMHVQETKSSTALMSKDRREQKQLHSRVNEIVGKYI